MRRHYPIDPATGLENAALLPWHTGNPSIGEPGSYPGHRLVVDTEQEVLNLQAASGLIAADGDLTQSVQALARGVYFGTFGGSANALSAAIAGGVTIPALLTGMKFWGRASATNTAAVTIEIDGFATDPGTLSVLRRDGTALQAGDLVSGLFYQFLYDGAAIVCLNPTNEVLSIVQSQFLITTAITKTVGGSGADFANLNAALLWASKYLITYTGSVRFLLAAGLFNYGTATVTINHPNADRITIEGAALTSSPPTYSGLTVTGSGSGARVSDGAANLTYLRGIFATELRFTPSVGGIFSSGKNPTIKNLLLTSDGTGTQAGGANGLQIDGGAVLSNVAISGWGGCGLFIRNAGVVVPGGTSVCVSASGASAAGGIDIQQGGQLVFAGQVMVVSSGTHGIRATMGNVVLQGSGTFSAGGNLLDGATVQIGGAMQAGAGCTYSKNGAQGVSAYFGASLDVSGAAAGGNGGYGIYSDNATIVANAVTFPTSNTGTIGAVGPSGRVDAVGAAVNGTESPAINGAGGLTANGGAFIRA